MEPVLEQSGIKLSELQDCLKLYLAMCEWFVANNRVEEVQQARPQIAEVLDMVQDIFPREEGTTQGWDIPKTHAVTKIQFYMCRLGSGSNFKNVSATLLGRHQ